MSIVWQFMQQQLVLIHLFNDFASMMMRKNLLLGAFLMLTCLVQAQDSLRLYVQECVKTIERESLYSNRVNWKQVYDTVNSRLPRVVTARDADELVIWVFDQLGDYHGMYAGLDSSFQSVNPVKPPVMSDGILAAYKLPRAVKLAWLEGDIAYYKMPAVLIGSNQAKMKEWANLLMDSLCTLAARQPRAYIIDLRMNNGGNSEPMWQALRLLIGDKNKPMTADARGRIIKPDTDSATLAYLQAAVPDKTCLINGKVPVAVLIGPGTASSGEIMALAFTTRSRTRLFGQPTIGVGNATNGFVIHNKGYLLLTVTYIADARKRVLKSGLIKPDEYISTAHDDFAHPAADPTVLAARKWLLKQLR